jgi:tRNA(Ile)-lysidine synthetase-like protein
LHPALLSRVLFLSAKECGVLSLEATHVKKLRDLIYDAQNKDFSVSIPGDLSFISSDGFLYVGKLSKGNRESFSIPLYYGINTLPNSESIILLSEEKIDKTFSNVYKIAIQQRIDFDIIDGGIFVREKRDGDSYRYGGMTHKLKKIFNDKGIKPNERKKIPIICDNSGILWVPGFPVRDKGTENSNKYVYIAIADKIT